MSTIRSLYKFSRNEGSCPGDLTYDVTLNPDHDVFKGHFPHQPVLPGVMILRLIVSCAGDAAGRQLRMKKTSQCKFLNFVDPVVHHDLQLLLSIYEVNEGWDVKAVLKSKEMIFTRASLILFT